MKIYAIGAMRSLKEEFKNIELAIIQPHHGEPRTHKMTFKELNDWTALNLTPAIVEIAKGTTPPTPSSAPSTPLLGLGSTLSTEYDAADAFMTVISAIVVPAAIKLASEESTVFAGTCVEAYVASSAAAAAPAPPAAEDRFR